MAVVGCYDLNLYCDTGGDPYGGKCPYRPVLTSLQGEFIGPNERHCMRQARKAGWTFKARSTLAYCPKCSRALPSSKGDQP